RVSPGSRGGSVERRWISSQSAGGSVCFTPAIQSFRSGIVFSKDRTEAGPSAVQVHGHGGGRHAEHVGDLRGRAVVEVEEHRDGSLLRRQLVSWTDDVQTHVV